MEMRQDRWLKIECSGSNAQLATNGTRECQPLEHTPPLYFYCIPEEQRDSRCLLDSDTCVVDREHFFVRGCLEIHVHQVTEPFVWGLWVSLSKANFDAFRESFGVQKRSHIGPFFGWLSAKIPLYPSTENLKTMLHLRDDGVRPYIELESTDHPLAVEQREGIGVDRVAEIYAYYMHPKQ